MTNKEETIQQRIKRIRTGMKNAGLDGFIITTNENICYLSGFTGHDSWLFVSNRSAALITDSRYTEQAQTECSGCKIIERTGSIIKEVAKLIGGKKSIATVSVEDSISIATVSVEDSISIATLKAIKKGLSAKIKPTSDIVESIRRSKDENEIKAIEKAAKISYQCLFEAVSNLKTGITESEVAGIIEYQMRKHQATAFFDTIVCFGPNCSRNHHQPSQTKLKRNDTVLIDFGAKFGSYGCDITRSFCIGKPTPMYEKVWFTVKAAQQTAIQAIKPGVKISDIDAICRQPIIQTNLPVYGHGTGHGLGLEVHESPGVSQQSKDILQPGDVITIEPGIYMPGKLGVRIEDDILVTETGYKILTEDKKFGFSGNDLMIF